MLAKIVKLVGYGILVFSLIFVGERIYSNVGQIALVDPAGAFYWVLAGLCVSYGLLQFLLVGALATLLRGLGAADATFDRVIYFHGKSNIAKYIPGNVFHYVGRQVLALSAITSPSSL